MRGSGRTAQRAQEQHPDVVVTAGDRAYNSGLLSEFEQKYDVGTSDDAVTNFGPDTDCGADIPGTPGSYWTVRGDWLIVHLNSAGDEGSGVATAAAVDDSGARDCGARDCA